MSERDYKKEYRDYHGLPEQKKRRAVRNKDRRKANREHTKEELAGKDVHHEGHNLTRPRLRDKSKNRADKKKR